MNLSVRAAKNSPNDTSSMNLYNNTSLHVPKMKFMDETTKRKFHNKNWTP